MSQLLEDPNEFPALLKALGRAQPAYCTKPTPGAPNLLAAARVMGEALGTPLFPWQALLIRVASEKRLDDPRRFRYKRVIITTPRQVGKTTAYRIYQCTKALIYPGRQAFYTAQTGKDARQRWKDIVETLTREESPLKNDVKIKLGAGDPEIKFRNKSSIAPFAPTAESLHGYTPHDVAIDEAFNFDEAEGADLLGAIVPAQQRIMDSQLLIFSTAGNLNSTWLRSQVQMGREAVDDPESNIAYLEWSMKPGSDPNDPESWLFHPGITGEFTIEDLQAEHEALKDQPGEWLRAYMNTWSEDTDEQILTLEEIEEVTKTQHPPEQFSDVCLGYELAGDRSRAVIAAAWYCPETGLPALRIAQRLDRGQDLPATVAKAVDDMPRSWGADDGGITRDVTDQLRQKGLEPMTLSARDFATATEAFIARVKDKAIILPDDPYLRECITAAVIRPMGQSMVLDRRRSHGIIADLIACVVALRLLENAPAPLPKPAIHY